jgi:hypothetical protein
MISLRLAVPAVLVAEQMRELPELRKLVRSAEAKRRNGRRAPQLTGRCIFKPH